MPRSEIGVSPINSLKVSLNGSLLGSVTIPSLKPRTGSFIKVNVIIASKIPGRPTPINAACHPLRLKGACVWSGYQEFQVSNIAPPKKSPIPAPIYKPLE